VPVATDPDEPEDGDDIELTPAQREALTKSMESLRKLVLPKIDLPKFVLPESTFKNLVAISGIAERQQSILRNVMKPLLDSQALWQKQVATSINSDIFKSAALAHSNLSKISGQLYKNVDFGLSDSFAKLAQQVAAQQTAWMKTLGPSLERLRLSFYPPNLRPIEGLRWEDVESVVMVDGIALYGVPCTSIAEALIRADSAAKRRDILGRRWKAISADCRAALAGCETEAVAPYVPIALRALDALEAGHTEAAQALTGSLLDFMVNTYFGTDRYLYTPDKKGKRTNAAYDEFAAHEYIALAPIWQAWQKFFPDEGLPVPHTFSRNATAHTVSTKQYTRRNAVQSLMIVSSLVYFFNGEARRLTDGD
jgi:hypothetical protein